MGCDSSFEEAELDDEIIVESTSHLMTYQNIRVERGAAGIADAPWL